MAHRKIIHVDMDAFFASVEQRDFPELRGKPVAVGGSKERGVVAAASYEARKFGVRSAMPSSIASQKCPDLIFVKHRFPVYKEVSSQIRTIFKEYTDLVEPLSLDEAFLDVTVNKYNEESAIKIAQEIREKIKATTELTASAGVSINKFLAKIASDINKPDGLTAILPDQVEPFLDALPIEKFFGVGKATAAKMKRLNIHRGSDLKSFDKIELAKLFGKFGPYLYDVVRGKDERPVKPDRIRKSISSETTYDEDIEGFDSVSIAMKKLVDNLSASCVKNNIKGKTVNLKIRFNDFNTITRSRTLSHFTFEEKEMFETALTLLKNISENLLPVRLIGVGLSNLETEISDFQLKLNFEEAKLDNKSLKHD